SALLTRQRSLLFFSTSFNLLVHFIRRRRGAVTSPFARSTRRPEAPRTRRRSRRRGSVSWFCCSYCCNAPLHRQRLPDDAASPGEGRPVSPELKLHGNPGHDAHGEVNGKDPRPESRGLAIRFVALPERQ